MRRAARILAALALAALAGCIGGSSGPVPIGTDIFKEFQLTPSGRFAVTFKTSGVVLRDVTPRVKVDGLWIATAAYATSSRTADADGATWTFADPRYPTLVYTVRRPEGTDHYEVRMTVEGGVGVVEGFEVLAAEDVTVPDLRDVLYFLHNGYNTFSFSGLVGLSAADRAERTPEGGVLLTGANFEDSSIQAAQGWWWGALAPEGGGETLLAGALTTETWRTAVVGELVRTGQASLRAVNGGREMEDRVDLAGGPARSETIFLGAGADYVALHRAYAAALAETKPAFAWEGGAPRRWSTRHQSYSGVAEADFVSNVQALAADAAYDGIDYAQLDQGYESAWGDWLATNEKFPAGLAGVVAAARAAGRAPGVWLAPLVVDDRSTVYRDHPEWVLDSGRGGPVLCRACPAAFIEREYFALDVTRPEVRTFIRDTLMALQDLGFGLLEIDYAVFAAHEGARFDPDATTMSAFSLFLETLQGALRPGTFLNVVGGPILPIVGGAHGTRVGAAVDYELWPRTPSHVGFVDTARNFMARFFLAPGAILFDPDAVIAADSLTDDEIRAFATVQAMVSGIYGVSTDLPALPPERRPLLANPELLAISAARAQATPLDPYAEANPDLILSTFFEFFNHRAGGVTRSRQPQRWRLAPGGGVQYVALFNWRDDPERREARLSELGLEEAAEVRDVWTGEALAVDAGGVFGGTVPAHGALLLRVTE